MAYQVVTVLRVCTQWDTAGSASAAPRAARSAPVARRARARAASLIAVSRSALRARRDAAAGYHRRLALRARRRWHGRAARPGACGSPVAPGRGLALRARRRRRGRCALGRLHVPPDNLRALPLGGGDVEDVVRCALLETLGATRASSPACRGREGGEGRSRHHDAQVCAGNACVLPPHVQCESVRRATGKVSAFSPRPGRPPAL